MTYDRDRFDRDRSDRERGMMDRAGDEVRSWFGDDEAQRRRERDERHYRSEERAWRPEERNYRSEEPIRSEGYRDYGDRWGRSYSSSMDRDRDRYSRDRDYQPGPAFQAYARGSQEFGHEGYGSARAYESTRDFDRGTRSPESWRVPGPHAGRGPRGYQRSDERIREEVNDRLTAHGQVDASDIEVRVQNGEVTLTGFVDSRAAKRAAEDCAEDVPGAREVHNQIRLRTHAEEGTGVGRTSVLGITEHETQTASTARAPEAYRSRARNT